MTDMDHRTVQLSPKKRKKPNMCEKLASALLHIRKGTGDDWLVKGELRNASAKEICAAHDWDHIRRWAEGGSNAPQNLQPLLREDHREKSKKDNTEIAKGKRVAKKEARHQSALLQKMFGETSEVWDQKPKPKAKIRSRNNLTKDARREALEWKEKHG
jgi:hypothetical protein